MLQKRGTSLFRIIYLLIYSFIYSLFNDISEWHHTGQMPWLLMDDELDRMLQCS